MASLAMNGEKIGVSCVSKTQFNDGRKLFAGNASHFRQIIAGVVVSTID